MRPASGGEWQTGAGPSRRVRDRMVMRPQGGALRRADRTTGARRLALRAGRFAAVVAAAALLAGCAAGPDSPFAVFQPRVPDLPKVDPPPIPTSRPRMSPASPPSRRGAGQAPEGSGAGVQGSGQQCPSVHREGPLEAQAPLRAMTRRAAGFVALQHAEAGFEALNAPLWVVFDSRKSAKRAVRRAGRTSARPLELVSCLTFTVFAGCRLMSSSR